MEDASTQELSNIIIPDTPEDTPQIDCFGKHWQECIVEPSAEVFHTGIVPHKGEEVMEESPPDGDNMSSDSSEESDSDEGTPRHRCSDSISQAEEEGEDGEESAEELAEEPTEELTGEPTEGPAKETAVECPVLR